MAVEVTMNLERETSSNQREFLARIASEVIRFTLKSEGRGFAGSEVSVLFTGDGFIASLNKKYRNEEGPTDVLSFPMMDFDCEGCEPGISEIPDMLGDVVISLDTAARQAESHGRPLRRELALLLVHGTLHLLGYDHDEPQKEAIMWARQDAILKALNI